MQQYKQYILWTLRILIAALFIFSAWTKTVPSVEQTFVKQIVELDICDWCTAQYLSRFLLAAELGIGLALLQPHYLRSIVIPGTILLLLIFCVHLAMQMSKFGISGNNCGCFGNTIKMTPLEALIKNLITIAVLVYLFLQLKDKPKGENRWSVLTSIAAASIAVIFVLYPFAACKSLAKPANTGKDTLSSVVLPDTLTVPKDTVALIKPKTDTAKKQEKPAEPKMVASAWHNLNVFGDRTIQVDNGKKILCFFDPDCDHCQATCKELIALRKQGKCPEIFIYFLGIDPSKIPDFFKIVGATLPYHVLDAGEFFKNMGYTKSVPGVIYLWNGNVMKFYWGTDANQFKKDEFVQLVTSPYKPK